MRAPSHPLPTQLFACLLAALVALPGCIPGEVQTPSSGAPQYQQPGLVPVPGGGVVNLAGGNLLLERLDLSIDTVLGTWEVRATYDALSEAWLWNFEVSYDGATFLDPSHASHDVTGLADGAPIPGSVWTRADADTIETRGGLGLHFDASGRLDYVAWRSGDYPRIEYTWTASSLEMAGCPQASSCLAFYTVDFDGAGRPILVTDERTGRQADFGYDGLGRLEVARSPLDVDESRPGIRYEYEGGSGLLTAVTSSEGERVEYEYRPGPRIHRVVQVGEGDPEHRFIFQLKNEEDLYLTIHTNPLGGETRYYFDAERRLHRAELRDTGEVLDYAWSGLRPTQVVLPDGVATGFGYLGDDLASVTEPSGNVVSITYAPGAVNQENPFAPPVERIEDSLGLVEERSYDAQGRLQSASNGEGEAVSFTHGPAALDSFTNAAGLTWSFPFYGVHGHWLEVEGAADDKRAFDPVGNAIHPSAGSQEGGLLSQGFDANRNLTVLEVATTEAGSVLSEEQVTVSYRSDGRMTYVARPGGADHRLVYDAIGRLAEPHEKVDGIWQVTRFEYNAAGHLTARERPNGMREEFDYDLYGRLTHHRALRDGALEGEAVTSWQQGRPASHSDSLRATTEVYNYDSAGRLSTVLYGFGETLTFEYDLRSRRTAEIYALPGQGPVRRLDYDYDLANRRIRVTADGGEMLVERVYTDGQLDLTRYGNGLERDYAYDPATGDLVATTTTDAGSQVVESTAIAREARQNPVRFAVEVDTTTPLATTREEYWLGVGGSLGSPDLRVGKRVWHWTDGNGAQRDFVYDGLSNQLDNASGDVFVYNTEASRLLQAQLAHSGETLTYGWDEAGFATSRNGLPLQWTATGRLAAYDDVAIDWDLGGRPIRLTVAGLTRDFVFFGGAVESDPETGALGALDLGVVELPFDSGARLYRHRDFRGNVSFVSDETGAVVTHYHYGPYGVEAVFGIQVDPQTFVGRQEIGDLMILGARIYDPAVGRFLSPDPIFQLLNQFSYTFGNPVSYWDPDGAQAARTPAQAADHAQTVAAAALAGVGTALQAAAATGVFGPYTPAAILLGFSFQLAAAVLAVDVLVDPSAGSGGADLGSGPCSSRCDAPSRAQIPVVVITVDPNASSIRLSKGTAGSSYSAPQACAPATFSSLPDLRWGLLLLLPIQLAFALFLLSGRSYPRRRSHDG